MKIINWQSAKGGKRPWHSEVTDAAKTIVMLDLAILKAEIENGMYKKPIEVLAKEVHYEPIPAEVRAVIIAAWQREVCCSTLL